MYKNAAFLVGMAAALLAGTVHAESRVTAVSSGTTALSTTSKLNVSVSVPRILYLRVGDAGATINSVTFTVGLTGLTPLPQNDVVYSGAMPVGVGAISVADTNGTSDGQVAVQLWTNNGTANLNCSGAALTSGTNTIALSQITVTSAAAGTLGHPGGSLACTSATRGSAGVNNLSDTWTYAYTAPATLPAAGNYTTQITYTASQP